MRGAELIANFVILAIQKIIYNILNVVKWEKSMMY